MKEYVNVEELLAKLRTIQMIDYLNPYDAVVEAVASLDKLIIDEGNDDNFVVD